MQKPHSEIAIAIATNKKYSKTATFFQTAKLGLTSPEKVRKTLAFILE
jgi:hypothetical protein